MMIIDKFKNFLTKEDNNLEIVTNIHTTYEFLEVVGAKKATSSFSTT